MSNENIIKNLANEITRNCQAQNVQIDTEFVAFIIDLMLLNPKYGKLLTKTLNRNNLEYFVNSLVSMMIENQTAINTLKMQFLMKTNYDKLPNLVDKHLDSIEATLRPLILEILEADPGQNEAESKKLFRKISIYIILASGLGNPGLIMTLKEGMAALESVFSLEDLQLFVAMPRAEKKEQLMELMAIVSGVRLFNRDCKRGGDGIPDLPFDLVDAAKACMTVLSNTLFGVMQRVNSLTTAIDDCVQIENETGNVSVKVRADSSLTQDDYQHIFKLLAFNRQYEVLVRRLLGDVELMLQHANLYVERVKEALGDLHAAVKYKAAVPVAVVFPLFARLWHTWRGMQNIMYLVSTVNRISSALGNLQDLMPIPHHVVESMLEGKMIMTDEARMTHAISIDQRLCMGTLKNFVHGDCSSFGPHDKHVQYLGFCALCLCAGALVPGNTRIGLIKHAGRRYAFCGVSMARRFSGDPERYVNEALDYARNNPHLLCLLNMWEAVNSVRDVDCLVVKHVPKTKVSEKEIQTEAHPIPEYKEKNYHWDLWEWKRRACQWATIVNCRTKSTQTVYSHLRSEIHCQTVEPRDKCYQTKKDRGMTTDHSNNFIWGLRGQIGYGQHWMDFKQKHNPEKLKAQTFAACTWPCEPLPPPSEREFVAETAFQPPNENNF